MNRASIGATVTDGLLILATLAGPVLAVQAQKWLERSREKSQRKMNIFYALMATRATRLAEEHVRALNQIDLEFSTSRPKERAVIDAWRSYALQLNTSYDHTSDAQSVAWNADVYRLFIELLFAMSKAVNFDVTREHLQRGIYYPTGHAEIEADRKSSRHRGCIGAALSWGGLKRPLRLSICRRRYGPPASRTSRHSCN